MEKEVEEYSHVLEGRKREVLHLCQGENWLRLVVSASGLDLLADTQDEDLDGVPNPSIYSLEEVGTVQWPTEDCYICIDVDGHSAAVKDMRNISDEEFGGFVVCLQMRLNALRDDVESGDDNDDDAYGKLEELPRRQLRLIHSGDRVCTLTTKLGTSYDPSQEECIGHLGLVLTYRRCRGTAKYKNSNTQASQLSAPSTEAAPRAGLRNAMETQDSQQTITDNTESQLPRSIETLLLPCTTESQEFGVEDVDGDYDDDGEETQLIQFATQEDDDAANVEDTQCDEPQVESSDAVNKGPSKIGAPQADVSAKENVPCRNVTSSTFRETKGDSVWSQDLILGERGKGCSHAADYSEVQDGCPRSPYRGMLVGDGERVTSSCQRETESLPDESVQRGCRDDLNLSESDMRDIGVHEPRHDEMTASKEELRNIRANEPVSLRPALHTCKMPLDIATEACDQSPAREACDDETVLDAPEGAASSVSTGRFEEATQPLPFSFTGEAEEISSEVPSAIESRGQLFSRHEEKHDRLSTELKDTISVDVDDPAGDDKSESTALTDVGDLKVQGINDNREDTETSNAKGDEEVLDDPEHTAVGPFSPRSQSTRSRSILESSTRCLLGTPCLDDCVGSGVVRLEDHPDVAKLSNTTPTDHGGQSRDSNTGRRSPTPISATSTCITPLVSGTILECQSISLIPGQMETTDEDTRTEPARAVTASSKETETKTHSSRKRGALGPPTDSARQPKARSLGRSPGLEMAGDPKLSSNSIGSRKRQRRELQNINVLVTGVRITAGHRSVRRSLSGA